jgi:hypothetical protein
VLFNPLDELVEQDGRILLESFLRERMIIDPLKRFMANAGDDTPIDLPRMLRRIEKQELEIATVSANPVSSALPEDWKPKMVALTPVNVSFLDDFMGGQAGGEVYGMLGPTGVGKTTLGCMIAVEGAFYQQSVASVESEAGHWYYVTYEAPVDPDIRFQIMSYAAVIERTTLFKGLELSTSDNLKDYEKIRWKAALEAGLKVEGEKERLARVAPKLRKNLWTVDMSGSLEENPTIGSGGVDEIVDFLNAEKEQGKKIAGVVIDYVLIAVKRQMDREGISYDQLRHFVGGYGDKARMKLARHFNCPVWLLHQLTGEANMRAPTAKQHHAMAAEAKNFADNLWYCFNLSTKHLEYNTCLISCSKARRSSTGGLTPIVFIDGAVCAMKSADDMYTVQGNQIIPKEYKNKIVDPSKFRPKQGPNSGAGMF